LRLNLARRELSCMPSILVVQCLVTVLDIAMSELLAEVEQGGD